MRRGPFDGFRRFFDRRPPLAPPPRRGPLDGLGHSGGYGSPFGFGAESRVRLVLIALAILLVGIYLGRHWHQLF